MEIDYNDSHNASPFYHHSDNDHDDPRNNHPDKDYITPSNTLFAAPSNAP